MRRSEHEAFLVTRFKTEEEATSQHCCTPIPTQAPGLAIRVSACIWVCGVKDTQTYRQLNKSNVGFLFKHTHSHTQTDRISLNVLERILGGGG